MQQNGRTLADNGQELDRDGAAVGGHIAGDRDLEGLPRAVGESSVILLHPPLSLSGVSIGIKKGGVIKMAELWPTMARDAGGRRRRSRAGRTGG